MKYIFLVLIFASLVANASDFKTTDAILIQSRKIDKEMLELQSKWTDEKAQLEIIEQSYKDLLAAKKAKIETKKKSLVFYNEIFEKTNKDKLAFLSVDNYLNDVYKEFILNFKKYNQIKDMIISFDDFNNKQLAEKFHIIVDVLKAVDKNERLITKDATTLKTGLIVSASGICDSDEIIHLKVENKEEK